MTTCRRALLAAALALAATGCSADFDPYNRLTALRVLAIQSEPVAPPSGEAATLSALVYAPPGVDVTSYAWSWCPAPGPAQGGYPCLVDEAEAAELAGGDLPPYDLGDGETATLPNTVDPERLAALCAATAALPDPLDCEGGYPVQVKLTVTTADATLTAVRRLRLAFDPEAAPNGNPRLDALVAEIGGEERALDGEEAVSIQRHVETTIRVAIPEAAAEPYATVDGETGEPIDAREKLYLTWFVESGDTDDEHTGFIDGVVDLDAARENAWTPAFEEDYARDESGIVVVVRDDRDGVGWRAGRATLEAAP